MRPALLLFDVDGTLLRTGGAGLRAMATVAREMFGPAFSWEGVDAAGRLDPSLYAEVMQRHGFAGALDRHHEFRDRYLVELPRELERSRSHVRPVAGALALLESLHRRALGERDVILGLLSGNYRAAVGIKLRAVGIDPDWFTIDALGDEAATRPELTAIALERYRKLTGHEADRRRVIVIGDTPRDVECALAHGCRCLGVATGRYDMAMLRTAGAEAAVCDLTDPAPLWALLETTGDATGGSVATRSCVPW